MRNLEYAGFWIRLGASLIDTFILLIIMTAIMVSVYGLDSMSTEISNASMDFSATSYSFEGGGSFFINYLVPAVIVLAFWVFKSATPGKFALKLVIVDAKTGKKPTLGQFVVRYLGYFLSSIFLLGFIWIAFDKRKQGWHDKLAGTIVVRWSSTQEVVFENEEQDS